MGFGNPTPSTIIESITTLPKGVFEKYAHLYIFKVSDQCTQAAEKCTSSSREVNLQVAEP